MGPLWVGYNQPMGAARVRNPYHFGSPAEGLYFTDREEQLQRLRSVMLNGQNLILIAPRRYGKSSLLRRAVDEVRAAGGRTGRVSLMKCAGERDVAQYLMQGVVEGPLGWLRGHATEFGQLIRRLRFAPSVKFSPEGMVEGLTFLPALGEVDWRVVIADVVRLLGHLAESAPEHPVSLVVDEFQKAYEINPHLVDLFKDLVDELPRVSLVFAGSKRHVMEAMLDPDRGALYNVGARQDLQKIPAAQFVPYLRQRAETGEKRMSAAVAERIYAAAAGVPNDVQLIAFWAFEVSPGDRIDEAAVEAAVRIAVGEQSDEFQAVFGALALGQQRLLKHIAGTPVRAIGSTTVYQAVGLSHTAVAKAGEALQRAQLVIREDGHWIVANGLLGEWLRGDSD